MSEKHTNILDLELAELKEYETKLSSAMINCEEYQKSEIDDIANERIDILKSTPYSAARYYVNITLNDPILTTTSSIIERQKRKKTFSNTFDPTDAYDSGVIIEVHIIKSTDSNKATISINSSNYGYDDILKKLIIYNNDKSYYLSVLNSVSDIENDINSIIDSHPNEDIDYTVVYSIATFSILKIKEQLESLCDESFSIYDYSLSDFTVSTIASTGKISSNEQEFINYLEAYDASSAEFKTVVKYSNKGSVADITMQNNYVIYDMISFLKSRIHKIDSSDKSIINYVKKSYENRYPGLMNSVSDARYKQYIAYGGDPIYGSTLEEIVSFYNTYEYLFYLSSLTDEEQNKKSEITNSIYAYEKTCYLYNNNDFDILKYSWNEEVANISEYKCSDIEKYIVMPPCICIKNDSGFIDTFGHNYAFANDSYDDNEYITYYLATPNENGERMFISNSELMSSQLFEVNNSNRIIIERTRISLDNCIYELCNTSIGTEYDRWYDQVNKTYIEGVLDCSEKLYVNPVDHVFFKSNDIFSMLKHTECTLSEIPDSITTYTKFIQYSSHSILDNANYTLNLAKKTFDKKYVRAVVDTIPEDPWENIIEELSENLDKIKMIVSLNETKDEEQKDESEEQNEDNVDAIFDDEQKNVTKYLCTKEFSRKPLMFISQNIVDDTDGTYMTYSDIATGIKAACEEKSIYNITYEKILNSNSWKSRTSILNQFSEDDWIKFITEYKNENVSYNEYFTKNVPVYLMSGYIFYPTGIDIYALNENEKKILEPIYNKVGLTIPSSICVGTTDIPSENVSMNEYYTYFSNVLANDAIIGDGGKKIKKKKDDSSVDYATTLTKTDDDENEYKIISNSSELLKAWNSDINTLDNIFIHYFDSNDVKLSSSEISYENSIKNINSVEKNILKYLIYPCANDICYIPSPGSSDRFLIYRVKKVECTCPTCAGITNGNCGLRGNFICKNTLSYNFKKDADILNQYLHYMHVSAKNNVDEYSDNINNILKIVSDDAMSIELANNTIYSYMEKLMTFKNYITTYFTSLLYSCNVSCTELNECIKDVTYFISYNAILKVILDMSIRRMKFSDYLQLYLQTCIDEIIAIAFEKFDHIDQTFRNIQLNTAKRAKYILPDATRFSKYIDSDGNIIYDELMDTLNNDILDKIESLMLKAVVLGNCKFYNIKEGDTNEIINYFVNDEKYKIIKILTEKYTNIETPITYEMLITINEKNEYTSSIKSTWKEMVKLVDNIFSSTSSKNDIANYSISDRYSDMLTYINISNKENVSSTITKETKLEMTKNIYKNALKINSSAKRRLN